MLIYVRHSEDELNNVTHGHDAKLTKEGKRLAYKCGDRLLTKYGVPDIIYCSPFRRTKETLKYMLRNLSDHQLKKIKFIYEPNIGRHFNRRERENPDVAPATIKANVPIFESRKEFHKRIRIAARKLTKIAKQQVVWCITHTTVYKRVAKIYNITLPRIIPYMHHFTISSQESNVGKWCSKCNRYHE